MLGLTLRKKEGKQEQLTSLRDRIVSKYDTKGLHVAQFIQSGCFGTLMGNLLERPSTPKKLRFEILNFLNNIDRTVIFVKEHDDPNKKADEIIVKINAHSPDIFVMCASGFAKKKCKQIKDKVVEKISGYSINSYETKFRQIYFINKFEENAN